MELKINRRGWFRTLNTPKEGWQGSSTGLYLHPDNIPWYKAPRPFPIHRCRPWSIGVSGTGLIRHLVFRCACGGALVAPLIQGWREGFPMVWEKEKEKGWSARNSRILQLPGFVTLM